MVCFQIKKVKNVASGNLFNVDKHSKALEGQKAEDFHTIVAKGLFVLKRARPDIQPPVAYLCTRVSKPTESDWKKMVRMLAFMKQMKDDVLTLEPDGSGVITWGADASFAVHPDMKSHTGYGMTMGKGCLQMTWRKQKLNTRSSTEAELVAADDAMTQILWTKMFLEEQGYKIKETILPQDNTSAIQLENENLRKDCVVEAYEKPTHTRYDRLLSTHMKHICGSKRWLVQVKR